MEIKTRYAKIKYEKDKLKIYINEYIGNSDFENIVVEEIAKTIDQEKINKIEIEIIRGKNVNSN